MKTILLFFIFAFYPFLIFAQTSNSTYLFYERIIDKYRNDRNQEVQDTTFLFSGLVFKTKSYSFSKGFGSKKEKIALTKKGRLIELIRGAKSNVGEIEYDSILDPKKYLSKSIEFFLVPINKGIKLPNLKGQLVW